MSFGGNYFDYSLTGRGIDRPGSSFNIPFSTEPMRSIAAATTLPAVAAAVNAWCDLIDGVKEAPPLIGARYYWTSDFFTIHRPKWGASLKAHGNNTHWSVIGGECDNGENMKGEHEGAGVLSVYNMSAAGAEYVTQAGDTNAIFPLWDWSGMNGITVDHAAPIEKCIGDVWSVINTHFVGATCDGLYAVFAMDTATHSLTARRSWFFFDNAILALAQSITDASPTSNPRTALASRLLAQPTGDLARDVVIQFANGSTVMALPDGAYTYGLNEIEWFASGGNGYIPALASTPTTSFGISIGTVSGEWSSIGAFNGTSQSRLLSSWLDHGTNGIVNESYAYAIFPAVLPSEMPALATSLGGVDRSCITNALGVQGATNSVTNVTMAVFWEETGGIYGPCASNGGLIVSVTTPAILLIREDQGGALSVSVSSPTLSAPSAATVTIRGRGVLTGAGCSPAPGGSATLFSITYPVGIDNTGKTVTVVCSSQ
jgi:hypothetical protein